MNASQQRIGVLLEQSIRLKAPLFQRPYVWTRENWEPLWASVRDVGGRLIEGRPLRAHFLGAVVLEQEMVQPGRIGDVRQIIDGQQRLTTIQLLLAVLRNRASHAADSAPDATVKEFAVFLRDGFKLLMFNHTQDPKQRMKIVPTTDDLEPYERLLAAGSALEVRKLFGSSPESLFAQCYLYFDSELSEWLKDKELNGALEKLKTAIEQYLVVVTINLDGSNDDAQEIFEILNTRGVDLLPGDLVKNFLLRAAEAEGASDERLRELHEHYWRDFDREKGYWRKKIRQGRLVGPRMNAFLQHYVTLKKQDEVLSHRIFVDFRSVAAGPAEEQFKEIRTYANAYRGMLELPKGTPEAQTLYRIGELDVTTFHPVLLETFRRSFSGELSSSETIQILSDIESYLVRRSVCGLSGKAYNRFVVDLVRRVDKNWTAAAIRDFLLEQRSESSIWPTDNDFRRAWPARPLYKGRRARVRMILEALEQDMRSDRMEKVAIDEKLTVEHLMPQKWEHHWPVTDAVQEKRRLRLLHTIGNLTLLTHVLNPGVSNSAWSKKRPKIAEHSVLALNRALEKLEEWTEDSIELRSKQLFEGALKIWPRPADSRAADVLTGGELREDDDIDEAAPTVPEADEGEAAILLRIAEHLGESSASTVGSIATRLRSAGVRVRPRRASLSVRLRLGARGRALSLFFVTVGGQVNFGWMRTGQLAAAGLADSFADSFYKDVADRFDVPLKDSVPDGLTVGKLAVDPEFFVDRVLEFVEEVRRTAATPDLPNDDEESEDDDEESE